MIVADRYCDLLTVMFCVSIGHELNFINKTANRKNILKLKKDIYSPVFILLIY